MAHGQAKHGRGPRPMWLTVGAGGNRVRARIHRDARRHRVSHARRAIPRSRSERVTSVARAGGTRGRGGRGGCPRFLRVSGRAGGPQSRPHGRIISPLRPAVRGGGAAGALGSALWELSTEQFRAAVALSISTRYALRARAGAGGAVHFHMRRLLVALWFRPSVSDLGRGVGPGCLWRVVRVCTS